MICPVCKAQNDRGPQCRRCRADLSWLFALAGRRRQLLADAREAVRHGDWAGALDLAGEAGQLRQGGDVQMLRAVCHLLARDFAGAWTAYVRHARAGQQT